jgi:hypothetical protein
VWWCSIIFDWVKKKNCKTCVLNSTRPSRSLCPQTSAPWWSFVLSQVDQNITMQSIHNRRSPKDWRQLPLILRWSRPGNSQSKIQKKQTKNTCPTVNLMLFVGNVHLHWFTCYGSTMQKQKETGTTGTPTIHTAPDLRIVVCAMDLDLCDHMSCPYLSARLPFHFESEMVLSRQRKTRLNIFQFYSVSCKLHFKMALTWVLPHAKQVQRNSW